MSDTCDHDKVYDTRSCYLTYPPMQDWICRKCGAMGCDRMPGIPDDEYQRLVAQKKKEGLPT